MPHVGLVPGPDGNMWLTLPHPIARITPAGAISEFSRIAAIVVARRLGTRAVEVRLSCPAGAE